MRNRLDHFREELASHVENLVLFEVTDSTHALARQIIAEMDEESQKLGATLILADRQEKGEGRGDHNWESPAGGLYNQVQAVTLNCDDGTGSGCSGTHYTIDGSEPTTASA